MGLRVAHTTSASGPNEGAPVASPSSTTLATDTPISRPMKWYGRHSAAYRPPGSVATPYSGQHCRLYAESNVNVINTPQRRLLGTKVSSSFTQVTISTMPSRSRPPPDACGHITLASFSTATGAKVRPLSEIPKPEAFATAAASIADFVPSRNELNMRPLKPTPSTSCGVKP